jgi:hypothetical protein
MKRIFLACLLMSAVAAAQTVTVSSSSFTDSGGHPVNGVITFQPALVNGVAASYQKGGGGVVVAKSVTAQIVNGAFSLTLPDTTLTNPANICFVVKAAIPFTEVPLLGPGYNCVQPHGTATSGGDWCQAGTCNFDLYVPNIPALPIVETNSSIPNISSLGNSDVTGQTLSQGSVNLVGIVPESGKYRISYYALQHALCTTGFNSVLFTFSWTDENAARTVQSVSLTLGTVQSPSFSSIQGDFLIYAVASSTITYSSTVTGSCATGGPSSYNAHITVGAVQ